MRFLRNTYQASQVLRISLILCLVIFSNSLSLSQSLSSESSENKIHLNLREILAVDSLNGTEPIQLIAGFSSQIYLLDRDGNRVLKLSSEGTVVAEIGGFGFGIGQFNNPIAMVSPDGGLNLYILDSENKRIVHLNSDLKWIDQIQINQIINDRTVGQLTGMAINSSQDLYISDPQNYRVIKLDPEGRFLSELTAQGRIMIPGCLAIDNADQLYVCDQRTNSIVIFDELERVIRNLESDILNSIDRIIVSDQFIIIYDYNQNLSFVFNKTYKYLGLLSDTINTNTVLFNSLFWGQNSHLNVYEPHQNRIISYDLVEK